MPIGNFSFLSSRKSPKVPCLPKFPSYRKKWRKWLPKGNFSFLSSRKFPKVPCLPKLSSYQYLLRYPFSQFLVTNKKSTHARTTDVFLKFGGVTLQGSAKTGLMKKVAPLQPHLPPVRMTSFVAAMASVFQLSGNVICILTVLTRVTKLDVPRALRVPRRNSSVSRENASRRLPDATASRIVQMARMKVDAVSRREHFVAFEMLYIKL